jgi:acetyl-CoA acetyltransferase
MARTRPRAEPTPFSVSFGLALRQYMRDHGITVERVADTAGRSSQYVYDHTTGLRAPDTDLLTAVAVLAHVDVRTLVTTLLEHERTP